MMPSFYIPLASATQELEVSKYILGKNNTKTFYVNSDIISINEI